MQTTADHRLSRRGALRVLGGAAALPALALVPALPAAAGAPIPPPAPAEDPQVARLVAAYRRIELESFRDIIPRWVESLADLDAERRRDPAGYERRWEAAQAAPRPAPPPPNLFTRRDRAM